MQGLNNTEQVEPAAAADPEVPATPQQQSVVDGSRPFPCGFCNAAFRQSNHRSYHERVIHGVDRRTRQPKGGPMTRIPATSVADGGGNSVGRAKVGGGARKSITRPSVGNGFNSTIEPEDDDVEEIEEDVEHVDTEEEVEDVEDAEDDVDLADEGDAWIDEEMASPEPEEDEQVEEEEGDEEEEEDEEAGSEVAAEVASPVSATTKVESEAEDAD